MPKQKCRITETIPVPETLRMNSIHGVESIEVSGLGFKALERAKAVKSSEDQKNVGNDFSRVMEKAIKQAASDAVAEVNGKKEPTEKVDPLVSAMETYDTATVICGGVVTIEGTNFRYGAGDSKAELCEYVLDDADARFIVEAIYKLSGTVPLTKEEEGNS